MKKFNWLTLTLVLTLVLPLVPATARVPDEPDGPVSQPVVAEGNWYIVEFEEPALAVYAKSGDIRTMTVGGKLSVDAPASQAYISQLEKQQAAFGASLAQAIPSARVERGYQIVLNAVAVELPNGDLETLKSLWTMPGVKRVSPQQIYTANLDYSLPLINAEALWSQLGGQDAAGAGIKVAVVDSGIDPDHAMFDGTGWSYPTTGDWPKGYCADHVGFCNGKLISARYYAPTFEVNTGEVLSPQDVHGHGSSMTGIAAGNRVMATYGTSSPEISGVAPGAWVMAYKGLFKTVAGGGSGSTIMLAAAVEDAIADGADVINNSWGSQAWTLDRPLQAAYEAAVDAGAVVVFSTGNSGPDYNTTGSPSSSKFIEVGASSTRRFYANEVAVTAPMPVTDTLQSMPANEFSDTRPIIAPIGPLTVIYGDWIALIPKVYGESWSTVKLDNAEAAGAVAAVMWTTNYPGSVFDYNWVAEGRIPTVMLEHDIGEELSDWWDTYTDTVKLQIGIKTPFTTRTPDVIASFSSRGPWLDLAIKPDVVAPGVNILTANYDGAYSVGSGTSPASPHVVGTAAMLLQLHPTWTPAQIKSALMTTASHTILELDETTTADVMTQGSGRIDLSKVDDPGLTFDKPSHSFGMVPQGIGVGTLVTANDVSGAAETYSLSVQETITDTGNVTVTVSPATLDITAGGTGSFWITVDVGDGATVQDLEGNIVVSGSSHEAHIPYGCASTRTLVRKCCWWTSTSLRLPPIMASPLSTVRLLATIPTTTPLRCRPWVLPTTTGTCGVHHPSHRRAWCWTSTTR